MKKVKRFIAVILSVIVGCSVIGCSMFEDFDAKGYVQALLDQTFQGDVKAAAQIMEDTTEKELKQQYEDGIATFVENNITSGTTMDELTIGQYMKLCEEIFRGMRYKVKSEKKISKDEYDVSIEIEPTDVFVNFAAALKSKSQEMLQKAQNGEYAGTEEEINEMLQTDFEKVSYDLLESSYQTMEFGKKETVVLKVEANDKNEFSVDEDELSNLIVKIMRLDEIQH